MNTTVYYEDASLILLNKPVGVLSQGDDSGDEAMTDFILAREKERGETPYVGVVHRLDRNVGGVMVYAKKKETAASLSAAVGDKEKFRKEYLAVVHGVPQEKEGTFVDYLSKAPFDSKVSVSATKKKGAKEASLSYRLLSTDGTLSLVLVRLHTGRTHQIRAQFAYHGLPLVGDKKYGARDTAHNIGLHAFRLMFSHPVTGKTLCGESIPDESFPFSSDKLFNALAALAEEQGKRFR